MRLLMLLHCAALLVATAFVFQSAPTIPPPDPAAAEVAPGYRVEVAVDGLMYPSSVTFDDAGRMYVSECGRMPGDDAKPPRILAVDGRGAGERTVIAASGLVGPITDLLWHGGKLYVSHKGKISVVEKGKVRDLVTDLPSEGDHSNNQLAIGQDGKLYFGQGSATNAGVVGEDNFAFGWVAKHPEVHETSAKDVTLRGQEFDSKDPRAGEGPARAKTSAYQPFGTVVPAGTVVKGTVKANGTILRCDLEGANVELFAWGFRNPYGVAFAPDGRLFVADAGSDERGSRKIANAPEKLFDVKEGAWYGWPDFVGGVPVTDPRFQSKGEPPLQFLFAEHPAVEKPFLTFELHSSITQIEFSRGAAFGAEG